MRYASAYEKVIDNNAKLIDVVYVEGFYPGAPAEYHYNFDDFGGSTIRNGEVVEVVSNDEEDYDILCSDIEDYGYDLTAEFVEDNRTYFVAIEFEE